MKDFLLRHAEQPNLFGDGTMDVVIDNSGHVTEVESTEKLQMELLKTSITGRVTIGDKSYGSTLPRLIGDKQYYAHGDFLRAIVAAAEDSTIEDYRRQQADTVPDDEKILRLAKPVMVTRDASDPTIIAVQAVVETYSGDEVEVTHQLVTS